MKESGRGKRGRGWWNKAFTFFLFSVPFHFLLCFSTFPNFLSSTTSHVCTHTHAHTLRQQLHTASSLSRPALFLTISWLKVFRKTKVVGLRRSEEREEKGLPVVAIEPSLTRENLRRVPHQICKHYQPSWSSFSDP